MKKKYIFLAIFLLLFILLIIAVKTVDVAPIGPADTSVGLSHINGAVHNFLGESTIWYNVTEVLGILAIVLICTFALLGLIQLIKRKSLIRVDSEILSVGCLYVAMAAMYVLFEVVVINYRPNVTAELEASFPSSHTMLICVVLASAIILANKYIKPLYIRIPLQSLGGLVIAITVVGRLLSGVHWFTDIIGGVLISTALIFAFLALTDLLKAKLNAKAIKEETENT